MKRKVILQYNIIIQVILAYNAFQLSIMLYIFLSTISRVPFKYSYALKIKFQLHYNTCTILCI